SLRSRTNAGRGGGLEGDCGRLVKAIRRAPAKDTGSVLAGLHSPGNQRPGRLHGEDRVPNLRARQGLAALPRQRIRADYPLLLTVLETFLERRRINHIGEAVAVAVLEVRQIQRVRLTNVGQGEGDDTLVTDVFDGTFNPAGHAEQPLGVETLLSCIHALD